MTDPGFLADVLSSPGNEEAKALLARLGLDHEECGHHWHDFGSEVACQLCGATRTAADTPEDDRAGFLDWLRSRRLDATPEEDQP